MRQGLAAGGSYSKGLTFRGGLPLAVAATLAMAGQAMAQPAGSAPATQKPAPQPGAGAPTILLPSEPQPAASPAPGDTSATAVPVIQPLPLLEPQMVWTLPDAKALLGEIEKVASVGLIPADYRPKALREAIAGGEGDALNAAASKSFAWLAEDLRDGRTPMEDRVQWFVIDPDRDTNPTDKLMATALETHDVPGVLASLAPTHPDYQALLEDLAATPASDKAKRSLIRVNLDRWRWMARDLGDAYLLTNVPEFQLRLTVRNQIIRSYRTVVGKPGRTATPQLAETIEAVVFNPTWTVPQSIVKGEGLGARLLANPASARRQGYKVSRSADGTIRVVQQPGPNNALGITKIDMPNPHAIYLHDTPSKGLFNTPVRAYSHGCIRVQNAPILGMTLAILGAQLSKEEADATLRSGEYTRVPMTRTFPVYLTYFTMARDIDGELRKFNDIYGRDKPVLASFQQPREAKTTQRMSDEAIIKLDNPL
jgi:murein L,D-transpeptidase YcbB/YkuD